MTRILHFKFTMGLFENPMADQLGKHEHRNLVWEVVRKSLILLKNGKPGDALPLSLPKKLMVDTPTTWRHTGHITVSTIILDVVKVVMDLSTMVVFTENSNAYFIKNGRFSYAIVVVVRAYRYGVENRFHGFYENRENQKNQLIFYAKFKFQNMRRKMEPLGFFDRVSIIFSFKI
jgi:beta-glucosidase-like glycosyl hydrolase